MVTINLEQEQQSLAAEILRLEAQIAPLQNQLQAALERLSHIDALLPAGTRTSTESWSNRLERVNWSELCRQHGWTVGGDSAHRVVRRRDPMLHRSIPHQCDYDGRAYP